MLRNEIITFSVGKNVFVLGGVSDGQVATLGILGDIVKSFAVLFRVTPRGIHHHRNARWYTRLVGSS